jgi:hypothetical protein
VEYGGNLGGGGVYVSGIFCVGQRLGLAKVGIYVAELKTKF